MRRIIRILSLLCNNRWVELLVAADVAGIDVLSRLTVGSLRAVNLYIAASTF